MTTNFAGVPLAISRPPRPPADPLRKARAPVKTETREHLIDRTRLYREVNGLPPLPFLEEEMSKIKINMIMEQREQGSAALYAELERTVMDERLPAPYRTAKAGRIKGQLRRLDEDAGRELREALSDAAAAPQARLAEGVQWQSDELTQAASLRDEYQASGRTSQLVADAESAFARGATQRGRHLYKAAQLAGKASTRLDKFISDSDPELQEARSAIRSLQRSQIATEGDIAAQQAAILTPGTAQAEAGIRYKGAVQRLGLKPNEVHGTLRGTLERMPAPDGHIEPQAMPADQPAT